jgi:hypothetical protein
MSKSDRSVSDRLVSKLVKQTTLIELIVLKGIDIEIKNRQKINSFFNLQLTS